MDFKTKEKLVNEYLKQNISDVVFWNDQRSAFYKEYNVTENDILKYAIEVNRAKCGNNEEKLYCDCYFEMKKHCHKFLKNYVSKVEFLFFRVENYIMDILAWQDFYSSSETMKTYGRPGLSGMNFADIIYNLNSNIGIELLIKGKTDLKVVTTLMLNSLRNHGLITPLDCPPGLTRNYDSFEPKEVCKAFAKMLKICVQ